MPFLPYLPRCLLFCVADGHYNSSFDYLDCHTKEETCKSLTSIAFSK